MESLNIQLTEIVNESQTGLEWVYNVNLIKIDENNITKNIIMPVSLDSENGKFLKALVSEAWNYVPNIRDPLLQAKAQKLNEINKEYKKLSTREGYLDYIKKSIGKGGSKIISEGKSMLDEQNIIEN